MLSRTTSQGVRQGVSCLCLCHPTALQLPHGRILAISAPAWNPITLVQRSALATKAYGRNASEDTATVSTAAPTTNSSSSTNLRQTLKGKVGKANNIKKDLHQGNRATSSPTATETVTPASKPKSTRKNRGAVSSESKSKRSKTFSLAEIVDYKHSTAPPVEELDRLQALVDKLLATNSPPVKRDIIGEHLDQAPLLAWIYDPHRNFHVSSSNLFKFALLRAQQRDEEESNSTNAYQERKGSTDAEARTLALGQGYDHLSGLLLALSTRAVSGHKALDAVILFMDRFLTRNSKLGRDSSHVARMRALFEDPRSKLLLKILDKNLKMGCSVRTLQGMFPPHLLPGFDVALAHSLGKISDGEDLFSKSSTETTTPWFASRKLDGVRCLVRIDRETGGIEVKSRKGKDIGNVEVFRSSLQQRRILPVTGNGTGVQVQASSQSSRNDRNPLGQFFSLALGHDANSLQPSGLPDAIFLDGEICVFSPASSSPSTPSSLRVSSSNTATSTAADVTAAVELGTENFSKAFSFARTGITFPTGGGAIDDQDQDLGNDSGDKSTDEDEVEYKKSGSRSRSGIMGSGLASATATAAMATTSIDAGPPSSHDRAMFCVFDCLTEDEFRTRRGTRRFSERIRGLANALNAFPIQEILSTGGYSRPLPLITESTLGLDMDVDVQEFIQVLSQTELKSFKQLEEMVSRGMELGWEGVMLRKDVGYEGKRSRNLLKIKQFQDAEYVVEEVMLGSMRVPIQGVFREIDQIMTNVVIRHRGNRVRVGSGFSIDDRIRYGKDPKSLIGKTITVQYFEESQTAAPTTTLTQGATGSNADSDSGANETMVKDQHGKTESPRDGSQEVWSLRFPTVKAIYDKGPRQM